MWLQGVVVFVPQLLLVLASHQDEPELHFNASGQFKIAQFADCKSRCAGTKLRLTIKWASSALVHFGEAENTLWGPQQDKVRCTSNLHAMVEIDCLKFPTYMAYDLTWITVSKPAELNSSDGQSANVGAARPYHLHWRYVTTLISCGCPISEPLQTRSLVRTSTVMLHTTGQGWCNPACRPAHPGSPCSEIMVLIPPD